MGTSRAPQRLRRTNGEVWRRALGPWRMLPWRARAKPLGFSRAAVAHFVVCLSSRTVYDIARVVVHRGPWTSHALSSSSRSQSSRRSPRSNALGMVSAEAALFAPSLITTPPPMNLPSDDDDGEEEGGVMVIFLPRCRLAFAFAFC